MKIEYRPAGSGAYSVLADESVTTLAAAISGFQVTFMMEPYVAKGYGANVPTALDMGNVVWKLGFLVERDHATPDDASAFIQAEPLNYAGNQDLKITVGAQVTYLANCVRTEIAPNPQSDKSTRIKYSFGYGNYTQTAP